MNRNSKKLNRKQLFSVKEDFADVSNEFGDQFYWIHKQRKDSVEIFYSPNLLKITGYTPEEMIGMNELGLEIIFEEDIADIRKKINLLKEDESIKNTELVYRVNKKSGELVWLLERILVTRNKKDEIIFKGMVTNITKLKNSEERFKKISDQRSAQLKARDNFLYILSHDLRAPFSSILGFTEILMNESNISETDKAEYLNFIHYSSNNQLQLVNYLLDWSNLQTGRLRLNRQRIQAQNLVFNSISALTGNAIRKNIEIKVDVPETIYIEVDERLMLQVLTNLVSNAIKFSPEGKTVHIKADRFNKEMIEFVVTDEGIGIPEKNQNKIFRFDKMFSTKGTKGEKGTGLGLSLVKEIVDKHNGHIWFYSKEKTGTEFHLTMPSSENTILLVENVKEDYSLFENLIKENFPEFRLIGTDNGFEAVNYALKQHPSLIVSSHNLPFMNGIQFVKSILRGNRKFGAPIIAILDSEDESIQKSYYEVGIKQVLSKPVNSEVFCREIKHALN